MPSGHPKSKKSKKRVFTIYLHYGGLFITSPLSYREGTSREINDINFDGIKELLSDTDVEDMLNAGYDNGNMMDLYVEHYDYDVMSFIDLEPSLEQNIEDSDCYSSDDYEEIENVDFQNEADDNVVIKDFSTPDHFLNNLSSTRAVFRCSRK
ncbi:hypothetical protein Tco_0525959 [Tanacetum coccineum]